ncbi:MAG TPA: hypothetical protein VNK41_06285 [Vicinamibacterales bacterium]|nr:hypothetical protein [Vicinamibacterales bacterium]
MSPPPLLLPAFAALLFLAPAFEPAACAAGSAARQDAGAAAAQEHPGAAEDDATKKGRDGKKVVTVRGCLQGTTLGDVDSDEDVEGVTRSLALRSSGEVRRTLKKYDRHQVEITGVLKPAPRGPLSTRWGGTTVSIGAADPRRSPVQQTQPAVASLEVETVKSLSPSCR